MLKNPHDEKLGRVLSPVQVDQKPVVRRIVEDNPGQVEQYRGGNQKVIGWFVGQVMKESQGKATPKLVNELLRKLL